MGLVTVKLEDTAAHVVALSILLLNLRKIQHAFIERLPPAMRVRRKKFNLCVEKKNLQ